MKKVLSIVILTVIGLSGLPAQSAGDYGLIYSFHPTPPNRWITVGSQPNVPEIDPTNLHSIGAVYYATDTVALQPSLIFGRIKASTSVNPDTGDSVDIREDKLFVLGLEMAVPVVLHTVENISLFVAPAPRFLRATYSYTDEQNSTNDEKWIFAEFGVAVKVGAQVTFGRFGVFSSWGLRADYINLKREYDDRDVTTKGPAFGTSQAQIGLVYYIQE